MLVKKTLTNCLTVGVLLLVMLAGPVQAATPQMATLIEQANKCFSEGQYEKAARGYKQALELGPSADAVYNLAVTYHHRLNYFAKAVHYYKQFLQMEPQAPEAPRVKAWLQAATQKVFPAQTKQEASSKHPPFQDLIMWGDGQPLDAQTQKGNEFLKQKNYRQAILSFRRALTQSNSVVACYNLGLLHAFELGHLQRAVFYYQRFLRLAPQNPQAGRVSQWLDEAKETLKYRQEAFYQGEAFQLRQP